MVSDNRMINPIFKDAYRGKRVLVTGHTGFKGSWLTLWLLQLGAHVAGFSAYLPSKPCNFEVLGLKDKIKDYRGDVCDFSFLKKVFEEFRPEVVFHLAAQAIVRRAYDSPKLTFDTNLGGTVNVLECIKTTLGVQGAVMITSDKCYQNLEWPWGYRETDRLGGDDPYSASKACAEIASHAYIQSYFKRSKDGGIPHIATTRAGNVIGGGDWAENRIVTDCIRAWTIGKDPVIRSPEATRPWQHVLEPLSGYLWLGANLLNSGALHGEAFNFGPNNDVNYSVKELVELFLTYWGKGSWFHEQTSGGKKENTLLKLSCDKSLHYLKWHALLSFENTVRLTAQWYKEHYSGNKDMYQFSVNQIEYYIFEARQQRMPWVEEV
jgi:CDP-glucose 4,6-dehydratase